MNSARGVATCRVLGRACNDLLNLGAKVGFLVNKKIPKVYLLCTYKPTKEKSTFCLYPLPSPS